MTKRVAKLKRKDVLTAEDEAWEEQFLRDNHEMIAANLQEAYDSIARGEEPVEIESLEHLLRLAREHHNAQSKKKP